jgi:hypothetical protein
LARSESRSRSLNDIKHPQGHELVQKHGVRCGRIAANGLQKLYFHLSLVIIFAVNVIRVAVNFEIVRSSVMGVSVVWDYGTSQLARGHAARLAVGVWWETLVRAGREDAD